MDIKQPKQKIKLYKALKLGYTRNINKQRKALKNYGYVIDPELTNEREHVVAFNPSNKKLLWIEQGTDPTSLKDLTTDVRLALGGLKHTQRFQDSKHTLLKATEKYAVKPENMTFVGHSLAGEIVSNLAPNKSRVYTYNGAFLPTDKARENVSNFRTTGDIVSVFAPSANTQTLPNQNHTVNPVNYLLKAHKLDNIKEVPVYF